jgi:hypothetical protein
MAVCYIAEFADIAHLDGCPVAMMPPLAEQTVAIGAEADSSAFNASTRYIRVHNDAICSIAIGLTPTATTSTMRLPADSIEYFAVPRGAGYKISVITNI